MHSISEKYSKYLLEVVFQEQTYYTVFGADKSDQNVDKLMVNADQHILLFLTPAAVFSTILAGNHFFDSESMQAWALEGSAILPYTSIDLDVLSKNDFNSADIDFIKSVYHVLGIVEDYAIQVRNEYLLNLMKKQIYLEFMSEGSDYFAWEDSELKITVGVAEMSDFLKKIYEVLKYQMAILKAGN